jgi:putative tricarboxylic transport membrane protein
MLEALIAVVRPENLFILVSGVLIGMLVGALPGMTALMAVAVATPFTFHFSPEVGLSLLLGIVNAAMFGGAISAILYNTPGTPAAVATTFDGYPLATKGEAGLALTMSAISSAGGTLVGIAAFSFLAFPLAELGLRFGPAEQFALAVFGLSMVCSLSQGALTKGLVMACLGAALSLIGGDPITGQPRLVGQFTTLLEGISLIPLVVGIFAVGEVLFQLSLLSPTPKGKRISTPGIPSFSRVWPTIKELSSVAFAFGISCLVGIVVGFCQH